MKKSEQILLKINALKAEYKEALKVEKESQKTQRIAAVTDAVSKSGLLDIPADQLQALLTKLAAEYKTNSEVK